MRGGCVPLAQQEIIQIPARSCLSNLGTKVVVIYGRPFNTSEELGNFFDCGNSTRRSPRFLYPVCIQSTTTISFMSSANWFDLGFLLQHRRRFPARLTSLAENLIVNNILSLFGGALWSVACSGSRRRGAQGAVGRLQQIVLYYSYENSCSLVKILLELEQQ